MHGGQFALTLTDQTTNENAQVTFDFDVSAQEIALRLLETFNEHNQHTIDAIEVSGTGVQGDAWEIEVFGEKVLPSANVAVDLRQFTIAVAGDVIPSQVEGIIGGVNLQDIYVSKIRGGTNSKIFVPVQSPLGANPLPVIELVDGANNQDNVVGGGFGNNTVTGSAIGDHLSGGPGDDTINGEGGNDHLYGGDGRDTLTGGDGEDHLHGGDGNDTLQGNAERDLLEGGTGFDQLNGGRGSDTYLFGDNWDYDVVIEPLSDNRNDDTLDFSRVSESITHVFTGGTLVSGTGEYALGVPQDTLQGTTFSTGTIELFNSLGFKNQTIATTTGNLTLDLTADRDVNLAELREANQPVSLRLLIDFGDGNKQIYTAAVSAAELNDNMFVGSVADLASLLDQRLQVPNLPNVAIDVASVIDRLAVSVTGLPIADRPNNLSVQLLAFEDSVFVGLDGTSSMLQRIEKIVAADADNTFVFGNDWGQFNVFQASTSSTLTSLDPDLVTAFANFYRNRELEIETDEATNNGRRLVLDFRQVTHDLGFVFKRGEEGIELEVEREEAYTFPFLKLPLESPNFRFNNIVFSNIDENTIIYTGRKENKIRIQNGITVKSTIIGSSGIAPAKSALDVGESIVEPLLTLRAPPVSPINLIDYTQFSPLRITASDLGGGTLPSSTAGTIGQLLFDAALPFPFRGNTMPRPTAVDDVNATLVNLFSVRNGGFGTSFAGGTHLRLPLQLQGINLVGSTINRIVGASLLGQATNDYVHSIPDEFRSFVASSESLGRNDLRLGAGNLFKQFLDSLSKTISDKGIRYQQLLGAAPSTAIMMGLTGADSYDFAGLWGTAIVLEAPDIVLGGQGQNAFPHTIDTLNFGGVKSDLHVTLLQAPTLAGQENDLFGGLGVTVAIVTPFDPVGIDWSQMKRGNYAELIGALFGLGTNNIDSTFDDVSDSFSNGKIVDGLFGADKLLALDGGVVFATGIESIIGSTGKTTIHFSDAWGAVPTLGGRIVGEEVVLDYSDVDPDKLPAALNRGVTVENSFEYIFDWLGIAEGSPFDFEASEKARAESSDLADFVAKFDAKHGTASLVSGDREFNVAAFFQALGVPIPKGVAAVVGGEAVGVANVADVIGTNGPDTLGGNSENNILIGFGGLDQVDGEGGEEDIFSYLPLEEGGSLPHKDNPNAPADAVTFILADDAFRFWDGAGKDEFEADGLQHQTFFTQGNAVADYLPMGAQLDQSGTLTNIESFAGGIGNDLFLRNASQFDGTVMVDTAGDSNTQEVVILKYSGDAEFTISYNGVRTEPISPGADASDIETAINELQFPDGEDVFAEGDGVTVTSTMADVWTVTFMQNGPRPLLRMEDAEGETYVIIEDWGDDLIIDQGGINTLDFSFFEGEIEVSVLSALNGAITSSSNGNVTTLSISATDGDFLIKLGDQVTGPIGVVSDSDALASVIKTELEDLTVLDTDGETVDVSVEVSCSAGNCDITFEDAAAANVPPLAVRYYDDEWIHIADGEDPNFLAAVGEFEVELGENTTVAEVNKPSDELSKQDAPGPLGAQLSDQELLDQGLNAFGVWISNAGNVIDDLFSDVPDLPFVDLSLEDILGLDGLSNSFQDTADEMQQKILSVAQELTTLFDTNPVVTTDMVDTSLADISATHSSNLKEFRATIPLAVYSDQVQLHFDDDDLGDFGLQARSSEIDLTAELDLDFVFGIDPNSGFYVSDPTIFGRLSLDHPDVLDVSVTLGPIGMGIEDGIMQFEVGVGFGTDGRLDFDTLTSDVNGSLLGEPQLASDASFNIYLPIWLQGALSGLQDEPVIIAGRFDETPDQDSSMAGFFSALATSLSSANFSDFLQFKDLSLDLVLDGLIAGLNGLVGFTTVDDQLAFQVGNDVPAAQVATFMVQTQTPGGASDTQQQILFHQATSGSFQLQFADQVTDSFDVATVSASDLEDALDALTDIAGYPDGISVTVTGSGSPVDPWVVQFLDPNNLAFKDLPIVNESLAEMLGSGSVDVITEIKQILIDIRSDLDDIQSFEIDANFALDDTFGISNKQLGNKAALKAAVELLRRVAPNLHSDSTTDEMALALAQEATSDGYQARLDDLRLLAAASRLAALGLDGTSTDFAIADVLAAADPNGYSQLLTHRQNLRQVPEFTDAMATLTSYGFDRDSTSADVVDALQTQPIEQAKAINAQLALAQTADLSTQLQLQTVLTQLGVLPDDWTRADGLPDPTDAVVISLDADSQDAAITALALLSASYRLTDGGLSGLSIDDEIETALAGDDAAISQAKADRDLLNAIVQSVGDELELNKRTLEQHGLVSDGSATEGEITANITSDTQAMVDDLTAALATVAQHSALFADYDALATIGLTADSDDTSFALPFVDADQYQSLQSDRDRIQNSELVLSESNDRLTRLGVDLTTPEDVTEGDLATAFVSVDLLGALGDAQQTLANSNDVDFASSADQAVQDANTLLTALGLSFARGDANLSFSPAGPTTTSFTIAQ